MFFATLLLAPRPSLQPSGREFTRTGDLRYFFTNSALGQKLPSEEIPAWSKFEDKAVLVAYIGISDLVVDPFGYDAWPPPPQGFKW